MRFGGRVGTRVWFRPFFFLPLLSVSSSSGRLGNVACCGWPLGPTAWCVNCRIDRHRPPILNWFCGATSAFWAGFRRPATDCSLCLDDFFIAAALLLLLARDACHIEPEFRVRGVLTWARWLETHGNTQAASTPKRFGAMFPRFGVDAPVEQQWQSSSSSRSQQAK